MHVNELTGMRERSGFRMFSDGGGAAAGARRHCGFHASDPAVMSRTVAPSLVGRRRRPAARRKRGPETIAELRAPPLGRTGTCAVTDRLFITGCMLPDEPAEEEQLHL